MFRKRCIGNHKMKPTTYINLSGGVDSTYYLWRWLKEHPDETILVHHCLYNKLRRDVEAEATNKILQRLKDNGLNNFRYVETEFNRGTVRTVLVDVCVMGAISGIILRGRRAVKNVLMSYCWEETPKIRAWLRQKRSLRTFPASERSGVFIRAIELFARRQFVFQIPYMNVTKEQMIKELPMELLDATWFCRKPRKGKPCGGCFNCNRCLPHIRRRKQGLMLSDSPHELNVRTSVTHIAKPVRHYSGWRYGRRHERILKTAI